MNLAYHDVRAPPKDYNRLIVIVVLLPSRIRMCVPVLLTFFRAPLKDYNRVILPRNRRLVVQASRHRVFSVLPDAPVRWAGPHYNARLSLLLHSFTSRFYSEVLLRQDETESKEPIGQVNWNAGSHQRWTKCCDLRAPPMKYAEVGHLTQPDV